MNKQQQVLRVLKIASSHGMNKLFAARELHVFGLGEIISRLKQKGHDIKTVIVNRNTEQRHVKYVLVPIVRFIRINIDEVIGLAMKKFLDDRGVY